MKTLYSSASKDNVRTVGMMMDDKRLEIVLTNEPQVIDTIVCTMESVTPETLLVLHSPYCSWSINQDWRKEHPISAANSKPAGYVCQSCHEPVECYVSQDEDTGDFRHFRYLCGCTMLLMCPEMDGWWSEVNCSDMWNDVIVPGAKKAHGQHGIK
jgi:hypothetical protein